MMFFVLLRRLLQLGFGIRSATTHIRRDEAPKTLPLWYLHG